MRCLVQKLFLMLSMALFLSNPITNAMNGNSNENSCTICFDPISSNEGEDNGNKELACSHTFHEACIENWFTTSGDTKCPVCRQKPEDVKRKNPKNGKLWINGIEPLMKKYPHAFQWKENNILVVNLHDIPQSTWLEDCPENTITFEDTIVIINRIQSNVPNNANNVTSVYNNSTNNENDEPVFQRPRPRPIRSYRPVHRNRGRNRRRHQRRRHHHTRNLRRNRRK